MHIVSRIKKLKDNNRKSNRDYTLGDRKFFFLRGGKQETVLVRLLAEKKNNNDLWHPGYYDYG